nr:hypothetical protein [Tanacetum cinerariifolium]
MATTIEQQVVLDEALVPSTQRLKIRRSNFRLPSDIQSKESTLQVVYDVLRRCPFFKAFLVTADVPEIYMQEFWATAKVHHHSIRFKMDNKKHIVNLETFRDMFLGHSAQIQTLTDVNVNKLFQPWRSFGAVINKYLTGKSSGFDSFRLSQAQLLWGLYHSRNIDYAFLIWEDFVYQVEHKNHKKSNEMYYPRFTKVIVHHFMSKDLSISRQNKVNWHYVRDDNLFSTIKVVSRHQNIQQYGAILPIELTNEDIRNTTAYKEYYACASREAAPKPKASVRRKRSGSDSSTTPPSAAASPRPTTAATPKLTAAAKGKQPATVTKAKCLSSLSEVSMTEAEQLKLVLKRSREQMHISQPGGSGTDKGTSSKPEVSDVPSDDSDEEISWNSSNDEDSDAQEQDRHDNEGVEKDEIDDGEEDDDDDDDDEEEIARIDEHDDTGRGGDDDEKSGSDEESEKSEDDGDDEQEHGLKDGEEERLTDKKEAEELYRDVDINQGRGIQVSQEINDSHVTLTPVNPDEFCQMNPFAEIISTIPGIVNQYMSWQMKEEVRVAVQLQTDRLHDASQKENDEFLRTVDENMNKIIKEQVKSQVKDQVSRILPRIEQSINAQLESKILTRSSHSSRTSYVVVADLSEMELKKILIEKMEGNKERVILKRRRDDDDDQGEGPSAGSDQGSKRQREGNEPESIRVSLEPATRSAGRSTTGTKSRQVSASESAFAKEPVQTTSQIEEPSHLVFQIGADDQPIVQTSQHPEWFSQQKKPPILDRDWNKTLPAVPRSAQTWISELAKQANSRSFFNELLDTPIDFSNFFMNRLGVDTLTLELLAGPTYEWMKGSCKSLTELEYHLEEVYKATTDQLDWINPEGQQYPHNLLHPLPLIPNYQGRHESALDVYSKRRIITVINLKIVEWHNYRHLDWISLRRDDDKIYKFKEGDFKRLRLQDIEDMLLLLVQGKLSNLTIEECFAFNVSLRMFTRSIVIQRRMEDLQLGVKSYQKRLNLTKPDTYRTDIKRQEAYTTYSNPRGFIYQNKDKKNRLLRIDELYKFSDGTLNDVRNALDDRLKGIRMQYLP